MTGSWKGRGNQYIKLVRVLYCKLLSNDKQLPAFPLEATPGTEPRPHRWEAKLCYCSVNEPHMGGSHLEISWPVKQYYPLWYTF